MAGKISKDKKKYIIAGISGILVIILILTAYSINSAKNDKKPTTDVRRPNAGRNGAGMASARQTRYVGNRRGQLRGADRRQPAGVGKRLLLRRRAGAH